MAHLDRPTGRWRQRLLGSRDSWRRIVLAGIGGGVALGLIAALAASLIGGSGSGALDPETPTPVAPASGPADTSPPAEEPPPTPEVAPPTEAPTQPPPTESPPTEPPPPEPTPTEPPPEPTATAVEEEPTPEPTAPDGE